LKIGSIPDLQKVYAFAKSSKALTPMSGIEIKFSQLPYQQIGNS
jgi:hypothetical protein